MFEAKSNLKGVKSKNIITSLGGDIRVTVKKEIGSKFIIRIPVIQDDEQIQLFNFIEMLH